MSRQFLFMICVLVHTVCVAQQYPFVYYSPKSGLINSRVKSIRQDSYGRMYFLTYGGLSVYDGARFTNYNTQSGLANELVNDVVEVTPDSLLVCTNSNKLNTLVRGQIGLFRPANGFCPVINGMKKSSDGNWYAVSDDGLYLFKDSKFTKLNLRRNGEDLGESLGQCVMWKQFILVSPWSDGLRHRLIVYDILKDTVTDAITEQYVASMHSDANGLIWIMTPEGIFHPDTTALKQGKLKLTPFAKRQEVTKPWGNIIFDAANNGWLFSGNKVQSLNNPSLVLSPEHGLNLLSVSDVLIDREGIIWIASDGDGVFKLKSTSLQLLNSIADGKPLSCTAIGTVNDTSWVFNSADHTICRIVNNKVRTFPLKSEGDVYIMHSFGKKLLLVNDKKIICIDDKNNPAAYVHPPEILNDSGIAIGAGILDKNGVLLQTGKRSNGDFVLLAIKNKIIDEVPLPYLSDQVAMDAQGRLWLTTRNGHIQCFTLHPEDPSNYLQLLKDFLFRNLEARSLAIDKEGYLWIGARYDGLHQFKLEEMQLQRMQQFTTKEGLTDNYVCRLHCDGSNNIWIGTQTGLDKLFIKNGETIIANVSKAANLFKRVTDIQSTDSLLWAMNYDGSLLKIQLQNKNTIDVPAPSLILSSIKQQNDKQNSFVLNVAAPSFLDEGMIRYSYLLDGVGNESWSEPSNTASFSFINLAAGDYTIHVRATFPEGSYPEQTLAYSFTVLPPWWQTTWARLSAAIIFLLLLIFSARYYLRLRLKKEKQLLEQRQAIERERTRIAIDMHDDFGAGLSRIKFLSETIGIKKQKQQPIEDDITRIRNYVHEMIDKMGEIVWALNEKNDSLSDLLAFTRAYTTEYLTQNGIQCHMEMPEHLDGRFVSGEFRRNVFLSVKEVLHNIVKHAEAENVTVSVQTTHVLLVTIKDDGRGFDPLHTRPFSNGLSNIAKRMADIGGSCDVKSKGGTCVILKVPLLR